MGTTVGAALGVAVDGVGDGGVAGIIVGASLGTAAAPLFLAAADTPLSLLVALPSVVAICLMWSGWKDTAEGVPRTRSQMPMAKTMASMLREPLIEGRPPGHEA